MLEERTLQDYAIGYAKGYVIGCAKGKIKDSQITNFRQPQAKAD